MKIYDCFLFFNELDLLQIRLEVLYPYVDYFIISECDSTFSGLEKPFYFEDNKHLFEKYSDKIIHIKNFDTQYYKDVKNTHDGKKKIIFDEILNWYNSNNSDWKSYSHWCLEVLHREYVKLAMDSCEDDDIIIFSDLDEIPNPQIIQKLKTNFDLEENYVLLQNFFYFYVNVLSQTNWFGPVITKFKHLKSKSLNDLRNDRENFKKIFDGGWHLSFMGGKERVMTKIKSWGHQEYNLPHILNSVESNMNSLKDLFGRRNKFYSSDIQQFFFESMIKVRMEDYYPKEIINLINSKYNYLIKN